MSEKIVYGYYEGDECFYIGKGTIKRSKSMSSRNPLTIERIEKAKQNSTFNIRIIEKGLTEEEALIKETELILSLGRVDLGTGTLTNRCNGGTRTQKRSGVKYRTSQNRKLKLTEEHKKKLASKKTGENSPKFKPFETPEGVFDSCSTCSTVTGLSTSAIQSRLHNANFPEWVFIDRQSYITCRKVNQKDVNFLAVAKSVSLMSADPRKKCGAVIVKDNRVISTGSNNFPETLNKYSKSLDSQENKYRNILHAEQAAILNAIGRTKGSTLYCTFFPCQSCSLSIIQSGISELVCPAIDYSSHWASNQRHAKSLLKKCGVVLVEVPEEKDPEIEYYI